ncbi:histamine H2 receptor-like [Littorina saxatilis]|uniref:G-protein coupled receptors family 1 profile domain-containing protein n=1 Tax=Littorina saxatilis TaxID=31220 RepID=A0AAN9B126_9CAEN
MTNLTNLTSTTDLMPPGQTEEKSTVEKVLIIIILSFIIVTAAVGNLLVCIAVVIDRSLQRGTYFLIASLAVADLLCAVLSMPFALYIALYGQWMFGAVYCRIWIASDVVLCTASILHLCPIALDRYLSIRYTTYYARTVTTPRTVALIAGIWAWSLLVAYVLVDLGWQRPDNEGSGSQRCDAIFDPGYTMGNTIISFFVPCIALLVIYTKLFVYVFLHQRKMSQYSESTRPVDRTKTITHYKRTDLKIAISLTIIAGSFMVCWVPFFSAVFAEAVNQTYISPLTFLVLTWLGYANSCINPVVYGFFTKPFRCAFRRMFCLRRFYDESGHSRVSRFTMDRRVSTATLNRLNVVPETRSRVVSLATDSRKGTLPLATDIGSGPLPLATDSGRGTLPLATDSGSGPLPLATDSGSGTLPLATDSGNGTLPLETDSARVTRALPLATDSELDAVPLATDSAIDALPLATGSRRGTLPLATDSRSGTLRLATDSWSGTLT